MLANGSEFVNWRHWLLFASAPWPYPTQTALINLLDSYKRIDVSNIGYIDRESFLHVKIYYS